MLQDDAHHSAAIYRQARNEVDIPRAFKGFVVQNLRRKLSAEDRERREREQRAAIRIQRSATELSFLSLHVPAVIEF